MRHFLLLTLLFTAAPLAWTQQNPAQPVVITTVEQKPFSTTLEALGTLQSNEATIISATVTDTVRAIHFNDGERVSKGDVLLEMTNDEEHALLEEARFGVEEAKRQYQRVKSLAKTNLATQSLLDERWQNFQSAQNQHLAMQSRLADRLIIAPFTGVLGLRNISVGTLVRPGDTITTLDDDTSMKLDISVPAAFLSHLKKGMAITATSNEYESTAFAGKIAAIDSRVDPATRSIIARAIIPNPQSLLKAGLLMTVKMDTPTEQVILLPEIALLQEGFKNYIYRVNQSDGKQQVEKVEIEIGSRKAGEVVVTSGLQVGDQVVTHGVMSLRPGREVSIKASPFEPQTTTEHSPPPKNNAG